MLFSSLRGGSLDRPSSECGKELHMRLPTERLCYIICRSLSGFFGCAPIMLPAALMNWKEGGGRPTNNLQKCEVTATQLFL